MVVEMTFLKEPPNLDRTLKYILTLWVASVEATASKGLRHMDILYPQDSNISTMHTLGLTGCLRWILKLMHDPKYL